MAQNSIFRKIIRSLSILAFGLAIGGSSLALGQVAPAAVSGPGLNAFVSFGGQKTHVINFTYNALGVDGGVFIQRSPLFGVEARAATYSLFARYPQTPFTAGYRVEVPFRRAFVTSAYAGAGVSHAVDAGPHYVALPAQWAPCWQVSESMAVDSGRLRWKLFEATFTDTYTSLRSLPALSITTGVVYSISNSRR
jgi:hypothetical protein